VKFLAWLKSAIGKSEKKKPRLVQMDEPTQRAVSRTGLRPQCACLIPQHGRGEWQELKLHSEPQDTDCPAWNQLLAIIERIVENQEEVFEPGAEMPWEDWIDITTLPPSISQMKSVREFRLYGSNLVRIPPEIGDLPNLKIFDIYTSYRLLWLPYEITRCEGLIDSRMSTRALYGNCKNRMPFPRLPSNTDFMSPKVCSVCQSAFGRSGAIQRWISLRVATDVVPLLVHACSESCLAKLPTSANGYIPGTHEGSLGVVQPPTE